MSAVNRVSAVYILHEGYLFVSVDNICTVSVPLPLQLYIGRYSEVRLPITQRRIVRRSGETLKDMALQQYVKTCSRLGKEQLRILPAFEPSRAFALVYSLGSIWGSFHFFPSPFLQRESCSGG